MGEKTIVDAFANTLEVAMRSWSGSNTGTKKRRNAGAGAKAFIFQKLTAP